MKQLKISFTLILMTISFFVNAKTIDQVYEMDVNEFLSSGIVNKVPAVYLWSKEGKPKLFKSGNEATNAIRSNFQFPKEDHNLENSNFEILKSILVREECWNDKSKNLVFLKFDQSVGSCQACIDSEEEINSLDQNDFNIIEILIKN